MNFMLCSLWDNFSKWVSVDWTKTTYAIVLTVLGIAGIISFLSFFKANTKDSGKLTKWSSLLFSIICFALVALLVAAKF